MAEAALRVDGRDVPLVLPASVPVALRARGRSGNAVGVMMAPLPTGMPDVMERLRGIAAVTGAAKTEARAQLAVEHKARNRPKAGTFVILCSSTRIER